MRKCRDCQTQIENKFILCDSCRKINLAKRKERDNHRPHKKRTYKPKPPHKCLTDVCGEMITGRSLYCPSCKHDRQFIARLKYNRQKKPMQIEKPITPTSLSWMDKFKPWMESGKSYDEWRRGL